ncbi:phospholipase A2 [Medicago truncatula]|uniref:Phospholipase A2 n=1 Tax=Medicago truncatula TaxID=3880 RepID=G7KJ76_MEDTR|nr:phospholipase A2 [Medicago truncatula]
MTSRISNIPRATVTFALLFLLLSIAFPSSHADSSSYCGIRYTGCPDEKPCDHIDACCIAHDDCVGKFGMTNVKCHKKFKNCLVKKRKAGKFGFSRVSC